VCADRGCTEAGRVVIVVLSPGGAKSSPDLYMETLLAIPLILNPSRAPCTRVRTGAVFDIRGHVVAYPFPDTHDVRFPFYSIGTPICVVEGAFERGVGDVGDDLGTGVLRYKALLARRCR